VDFHFLYHFFEKKKRTGNNDNFIITVVTDLTIACSDFYSYFLRFFCKEAFLQSVSNHFKIVTCFYWGDFILRMAITPKHC